MKKFSDLSVGTKLIAGFTSVAVIAAAIGFVGISKLHRLDLEDTKMYEKVTVPLGDIGRMSVAFQRIRINVRDAVEVADAAERRGYVETVRKLRQEITERAESYQKNMLSEEEGKVFSEYQDARKNYVALSDQVLQLSESGRSTEARALLHGNGKQAALKVQGLMDKLSELKAKQGSQTSDANTALATGASRLMIALVVMGVILAIVLGLFISRVITSSLRKAVEVADRLAAGDLTVEVVVTSRDESGQLLLAMQNMVQSLRDMVSQTVHISTGIAAASSQLHSASVQIATGAEEVASQSGTVATASEEMSATSSDIARNCLLAAEVSTKSTATAQAGANVVQETIVGMGLIANRVRETSRTVEALGARSEEIGNIVGTIEDIADQTNLLALNAAIEAARAGEQGRGFAVVADEVRALAERTSNATREIGSMIKAIQGDTKEAVHAMEEGVKEVEKGAASSRKSGEALEEILGRINEVAMQVSQIATAAEQQTATTSEVTTNIQQITQVVHETASGAEQTAGAAAQLAQDANQLQALVGRFKLA